ncbi:TetR/AcrR family transcriptional regulator [Kribbella qitaiheensis]|uniref:TetR/AcrR family transcriptional regulator n=1 Tax=Kribbella qitaiheensis TaxID=1544730 RepID=A0A7G6X6D3_9ACTN|nr:TetR/AcrR family transcriptional regulator [Kribbella qitaiheensis]QNE21798.1 TetR/AcrR family transcriptional regulator [Kribbella qitaiheensis]
MNEQPQHGRRERKKTELRTRLSDVAIALFLERGFDEVSVSEVAEAADVARPTVFAHFPRKEDLVFDRYPEAEALVVGAITDRPAGSSAVTAVSDLMISLAEQGHPLSAIRAEFAPFWRLVAASRPLQSRARERLEHLEQAMTPAMEATDVPEPRLTAALTVAAYRTVHLTSVERVLAGEDPAAVAADHLVRVRATLARLAHFA